MLIETESLSKSYGDLPALVECTFDATEGEVVGLLGPNGAGKTTLLRLLLGYLKPTSGQARVAGLDCYTQSPDVHRQLSYLPGEARLFRRLTGLETLRFFARLRNDVALVQAKRLAERLALDLSRQVRQMSTGMRQKLAVAIALAPDVPLVILDEPTASLDPTVRNDIVQLIRDDRATGKTVLFSSHVLSEVEQACDRVILLRDGRLVESVRIPDVREQHRIRATLRGDLSPLPDGLVSDTRILPGPQGELTIVASGDLAQLLGWLAEQPLSRLQIEPVGLRAIYERHHGAANS